MVEEKTPYLVFGFDAGKASLGWCVLDLANHRVVALNSRLFDDPAEPKTGVSYAAKRSEARRKRKLNRRHRAIKTHCLRMCEEFGLVELPHDAGGALRVQDSGKEMQRRKGEPAVIELRAAALDRLLMGRELARVLYWLSSHRGYIPHGEASDSEGRAVLSAVKANAEEMMTGSYRTIGELLNKKYDSGKGEGFHNKAGDYSLCVSNDLLVEEIEAIFACQAEMGNPYAKEDLKERFIEECLTYLTKTADQEKRTYSRVAPCLYFAPEKAAARCCLSFEMAKAWEKLRNVRIRLEQGGERRLSDKTVNDAMAILFSPEPIKRNKSCKVTWKALRDMEGMSGRESFKAIEQDAEKSAEVVKPVAWRVYREKLSFDLLNRMLIDRSFADALGSALAYSSRGDSLRAILEGDAEGTALPQAVVDELSDLTESEIDEIASIDCTSKVFSGYGTRSTRALRMIVEEFEQGVASLSDAEDATGLFAKRLETGEKTEYLGCYEQYDPTCTNPVVLRAMSQFRKVLNAMIREYGRPAEVHIELSRDLKIPKKMREKIDRDNNKRARERDALRSQVSLWTGVNEADVAGKLLFKLELYEEQGGRDIYTDGVIDRDRLLADPKYAEVDHVLPYSRSLDNSRSNKVLVLAKSNQDKRNRTPYEWMTSGEPGAPDWAGYCARVQVAKLAHGKKNKLVCDDFAENEQAFIDRNLNDTRYMTRHMAQWVEDQLDFSMLSEDGRHESKRHVRTPAGAVTSKLRYAWGFDRKDRDKDNLHHAVDAATIAACSQRMIQAVALAQVSKKTETREKYEAMLVDSAPWPGFANQVQEAASRAIPSRMANRSMTGQLFEDSFYRLEGVNEKGYQLLSKGLGSSKETKPAGNYVILRNGAILKPDGQAFLQLWWDPEGKARGRKDPGCWLADVVYYSDIRDVQNGTYTPRFGKQKTPRMKWDPVPERAKVSKPIRLYAGDLITVKGQPRIYLTFDISGYAWSLAYPDRDTKDAKIVSEATKGLTISSCGRDDIKVLDAGPLGLPFGLEP